VANGQGNLRELALPPLDLLEGFKVYKPKVEERLQLEGNVSGEKILEYLLLPTRTGKLTIPAFVLDYFDPGEGRYKQARSTPIVLNVTGVLPTETEGGKGVGAGKSNVLGPTIRPPRPASHLTPHEALRPHQSPIFVILVLLPVAVILFLTGGERLKARLLRQTPGTLRRAASRRTRGHLQRAQDFSQKANASGFFSEIEHSISSLLDYRLGVATEGLTRAELRVAMLNKGFSEPLVNQVHEQLDACDLARFAPSASSPEQMGLVLKQTHQLVDQLGRVSLRLKAAPQEGATTRVKDPLVLVLLLALAWTLLGLPGLVSRGWAEETTIDQVYAKALKDYYAGRYQGAIAGLERLLAIPLHHQDLYYNLGCAYYRAGKLGPAIYSFERTLALEPSAEDAQFNLRTARSMAAQKVKDDLQGASDEPWWVRLVNLFTLKTWMVLFLLSWWLVCGIFVLLRYIRPGPSRAALVASNSFMGLIALTCGAMLGLSIYLSEVIVTAVVLPDKMAVHEGPGQETKVTFKVHAGLKVRIQEQQASGWVRIRLANGLEGWVPAQEIGRLTLPPSSES
jgi:tetratricopeptide (TPR) repeat protein